MNREAWRATVHGVAKSQTRLSDLSMNERILNGELTLKSHQELKERI